MIRLSHYPRITTIAPKNVPLPLPARSFHKMSSSRPKLSLNRQSHGLNPARFVLGIGRSGSGSGSEIERLTQQSSNARGFSAAVGLIPNNPGQTLENPNPPVQTTLL
jgi:hypothetical protein